MIRNYFKIAWRNLLKNKGFSIINITGLGIGIAACILIAVYIMHETSYDKFVPNSSNIYRLTTFYSFDENTGKSTHFSANTAPVVQAEFDEVEIAGRLMANPLFYGAGSNEIRMEGDAMQYHEEGFTYADQSIIDIFSIPMVFGDAKTALSEPKTIVISESVSKKYFKGKNPVGKIMYLNGRNDDPFKINGVMRDFPSNSHLEYDFLITLKGVEFGEGEQTRWIQNNYFIYITLRPDTDLVSFEKKLSHTIIVKYTKPALLAGGYTIGENLEDKAKVIIQPVTDIHLHSTDIGFEAGFRNDIKIIWIFGIVALFILIIASINFINLSTAKSASRAKEVGMRKVVGSHRSHLIGQFLTESALITFISFAFGILFSLVLLPYFRSITGIDLSIPWSNPAFVPTLILTALLVGILAGLYPSLYLSGFKPIHVLKGTLKTGSKSGSLRSGLVVFQFSISIILIVGTLIINEQMNFILNTKVGFEKEQVIQLYGTHMLKDKIDTFKEEIKDLTGVKSVSISDFLPIEGTKRNGNSFVNEGRDNIDETVPAQAWVIDEDYIETLGMQLVEGRNFSKERSTDEKTTIINQTMAEKLGLDNPIGKKISRNVGDLYEIIGVVEDFNFSNMKEKVQPLCFFFGTSPTIISMKVSSENIPELLNAVEEKWKAFAPSLAFRYAFMDQSFAQMYKNVSRIKTIFTSFSIFAIFVACLGLFALSAYMLEQRTKEIGVRKVLGASINSIVKLLSKDFLKLVIIALFFAIPIAYYMMSKWLQDFVYRIDIEWWTFAVAGVAAVIISFITISFQSIKAARTNPVKSLRTE